MEATAWLPTKAYSSSSLLQLKLENDRENTAFSKKGGKLVILKMILLAAGAARSKLRQCAPHFGRRP